MAKQVVPAKFPGEEQPLKFEPGEDRRERLAAWLTSPNNAYFAPAIVNRIWKQFMGRGIIDPEDIRITNPATHPELLKKLSDDFVASGYDLRHLMKAILNSRTYQLSSRVNDSNKDDTTSYSHYYTRHLTAEQMLDAIDPDHWHDRALPSHASRASGRFSRPTKNSSLTSWRLSTARRAIPTPAPERRCPT